MVSQTTKTIDDCLTEVRQILNDSVSPYRYSDNWLIYVLNTALRDLYRLRPDAYIGNFTSGVLSANLVNTYSTADLQVINGTANPTPPVPITPFPVDDRLFYGPIVFYMIGRVELNDDEFADNNRAMTLLQAFHTQLIGVGG
jgi:hypothetical protein